MPFETLYRHGGLTVALKPYHVAILAHYLKDMHGMDPSRYSDVQTKFRELLTPAKARQEVKLLKEAHEQLVLKGIITPVAYKLNTYKKIEPSIVKEAGLFVEKNMRELPTHLIP